MGADFDAALVWVVEAANDMAYNGYTAVLVRGFEAVSAPDGLTQNSAVPSVNYNYETGRWELSGGYVHAIANLGESAAGGEFLAAGTVVGKTYVIDRFSAGDLHVYTRGTSYAENGGMIVVNQGQWDAAGSGRSPVQTTETAYPYYMFVFKTGETGVGNINAAGADALVGMFYEELNNELPTLQENFTEDKDILVVRFNNFYVVPEPATAALFALGIACLARRRRRRE
jgi:PEP-CTERM putative exosortase interaction domain